MTGSPRRKSSVGSEWRKDGDQEGVIMARVNRKMNVSSNIAESTRQRMRCVLGVWGLLWKLIWSPPWSLAILQQVRMKGIWCQQSTFHHLQFPVSIQFQAVPSPFQWYHFGFPRGVRDTRARYTWLQLGKEMLSLTSRWPNTSSFQIGRSGPTIHQEVTFLAK